LRRPGTDQPLAWTGNVHVRAARLLANAGYDVRRLLDDRRPEVLGVATRATGLLVALCAAAGAWHL
jgi:hypothetical protein